MLGTRRLHKLHELKVPFVSSIKIIRSKLTLFSAYVAGVTESRRWRPSYADRCYSTEAKGEMTADDDLRLSSIRRSGGVQTNGLKTSADPQSCALARKDVYSRLP